MEVYRELAAGYPCDHKVVGFNPRTASGTLEQGSLGNVFLAALYLRSFYFTRNAGTLLLRI